jgi:hypothetical protein
MTADITGPWGQEEVESFFKDALFPMRLGCNAADGFPRVVSLWYQYQDGQLLSVTHRDSKLAALLRRDQKVGFEIAPNTPPYFGVRGQATVTLQDLGDSAALEQLLERYLGSAESDLGNWLLGRSSEEILITMTPFRLYGWDYRQRMAREDRSINDD